MKHPIVPAACMFLLVAFSRLASAGDQVISEADRGAAMRSLVKQVHDTLGFSGVVLAAREGRIVETIAIGPSNQGFPLTNQTLFEIASCTKPFTAIAILQLAENGQLSLDEPIDKYLPNVPQHSRAITIRQLLSHTSGIPGTNSVGSGEDFDKVLPTFLQDGPKQAPGARFEYWNQGYSILSEIIARVSGRPYTAFVRENIFQRCGMERSCFTGDAPVPDSRVAVGVSTYGKPRTALEHPYGSYGFQYRGMGGIVTNVEELWRWDRSLKNGELIGAASYNEMITAGKGGYGLGWFIGTDPDGSPYHRHGGSVRGFLAEVRRYPSIDGAIVVLANQDDSLPMVTSGVEQLLFGQSPKLQLPKPPTAELIDAVAGRYEDAQNRTLTITKSRGLPSLRIDWVGPVTAGYLGLDDKGDPQLFLVNFSGGVPKFKADVGLEFIGIPAKADSVLLLLPERKLTFRRVGE